MDINKVLVSVVLRMVGFEWRLMVTRMELCDGKKEAANYEPTPEDEAEDKSPNWDPEAGGFRPEAWRRRREVVADSDFQVVPVEAKDRRW